MFYKFIFKIGQSFRNPSLKKWLKFLKKTEKWSSLELYEYQLKKLQELVQLAYKQSYYYKYKLDEVGINPSDIKTLDDIQKLPILSKEDLIKNKSTITTNIKFKKVFKASTSGSTGQSLNFLREESADSFNRAAIFRGYSWYKVNPWELNGYFWGYNLSLFKRLKFKLLDKIQHRFRIFTFNEKPLRKFNKKLKKASYLHGYSSMIYEVAKFINKNGLSKPFHLKMIKGTSEKIFDSYQIEIKNAFGIKMISEYGAAETGIIAFECTNGNMHINMEGVLVEEIANEIVITNLQMTSFPVIRYKLGDYIKLAPKEKKCSCGMNHLIIEEITGRVGVVIFGLKNSYPSLYIYYIFKNLGIENSLFLTYQVVQKTKGNLIFKIEETLDKRSLLLLKKEIIKHFKQDVTFKIIDNQKINSSKKQKSKSFISEII
ncbi:capsule biosynthesis protein CapK [Lutibacter profundi]|uniref:Capsule biosynthesis protein CapK n=1 Tax=Lutibacter profundi TaxID=1622118 RepID=A0A109RNY6_9FLAO|nr:phenylacetate--CoA ligase family protein [Lutibacter profundi]AMC10136.1 capsule biosynthesis protein CapK [Lutibacter profundi]